METVANDLRVANALHWIARILCITAILFIGMFSLDVFEPGLPLRQQLLGFFMHNIPALILVGLLIVAGSGNLSEAHSLPSSPYCWLRTSTHTITA